MLRLWDIPFAPLSVSSSPCLEVVTSLSRPGLGFLLVDVGRLSTILFILARSSGRGESVGSRWITDMLKPGCTAR